MKNLIYIITSFILFSCNGQSNIKKNEIIENKNDETNITVTLPKTNLREIPKTWKSLNAIQKEWMKLEKDKDGYLIYEPCDGNTENIKFENSSIVINYRIESQKYNYEKFTRITSNDAFRLDAGNAEMRKSFEIQAKIVDFKNGIVLWDFDGIKWFMTPKENYAKFRIIKNNCKTEKIKELDFLPIENSK